MEVAHETWLKSVSHCKENVVGKGLLLSNSLRRASVRAAVEPLQLPDIVANYVLAIQCNSDGTIAMLDCFSLYSTLSSVAHYYTNIQPFHLMLHG